MDIDIDIIEIEYHYINTINTISSTDGLNRSHFVCKTLVILTLRP